MVVTSARELILLTACYVRRIQRLDHEETWTHISCCFLQQCTQSETQTQASACSRSDTLNWGGHECVITYPLTFVSQRALGSLSQATSIPQFLILRDCILL